MTWLIGKTDRERVIDPYMGSGTTLVAARVMGRKGIGVDEDEWCCEIAAKRLQQSVMPLFADVT